MTNCIVDVNFINPTQCFPRYLYGQATIFDGQGGGLERFDAMAPQALEHFSRAYGQAVTADDLFYYVYGLLHSPDYRERYKNNLMKELPRIPRVATWDQFRSFAEAGRALGDLHVNFESARPYDALTITGLDQGDFRVSQLKYGKIPGKKGHAGLDKATIVYNSKITIEGIPLEVQDYVVNRKSALDWVVERACVKTDKASGIVNDFNAWGAEHGQDRYILDLILKVITVSLETLKIVASLPPLEIHPLDRPKEG